WRSSSCETCRKRRSSAVWWECRPTSSSFAASSVSSKGGDFCNCLEVWILLDNACTDSIACRTFRRTRQQQTKNNHTRCDTLRQQAACEQSSSATRLTALDSQHSL
ncbi:unnamed protein product, partial [Ectocarpus sp. 12 AP-2014]